jgi:hypothetical protein
MDINLKNEHKSHKWNIFMYRANKWQFEYDLLKEGFQLNGKYFMAILQVCITTENGTAESIWSPYLRYKQSRAVV